MSTVNARLRECQQALGAAREWDVLIDQTIASMPKRARRRLHPLVEAAEAQRADAHQRARAATLDAELVDVCDDPARQQPQLPAEGLLAAPGFGRDRAQDPSVWWREIDRRDQVGEYRGGAMAELGQQECHIVAVCRGC